MWRYRIVFGKGAELKYISHLDLVRAWQRVFRRAGIAMAHSQGFSPHPRMFFASALPVGVTGRCEMLDVVLEQRMQASEVAARIRSQLPSGLDLISVVEVPLAAPALPTQVTAAEYEAEVEIATLADQVQSRLDQLLATESLPRRMQREDKVRDYDLRPLVQRLWLAGRRQGAYVIGMRLQADPQGTGRPDQVLDTLGMAGQVKNIERTRLLLRSDSVAQPPHSR
jgi:radical SAM-linked protein